MPDVTLNGFAIAELQRIHRTKCAPIPYVPVFQGRYVPGHIRYSIAKTLVDQGLGDWVGSGEQLFRLTVSGHELAEQLEEPEP